MEGKANKNTIVLIIMFIVALLIGLVGIIYLIISFFNPTVVESQTTDGTIDSQEVATEFETILAVIPPEKTTTDEVFDYDFGFGGKILGINTQFASELAQKAARVKTPNSQDLVTISINTIGVSAPVIHHLDGDYAIDQGWWIYPASEDYGEKIILAHRRYWEPGHPYSAWNIDQLQPGTVIQVTDKDGITYNYAVASQAVRDGYDLGIFRPSGEDIIKIVTCSTWNGGAGSSDYRSVTIAVRID